MYDCVIILGGSLKKNSELPDWVLGRLDYALKVDTKYLIVSSRGTTHKSPPLDENKMPIDETTKMAEYLISQGINPNRILCESWSLDTIGNAYGVLMFHCIPLKLEKLLVVTSDFHIERTKSIFKKVFSLSEIEFKIDYCSINSSLKVTDKERKSLEDWNEKCKNFNSLEDLHKFIFTQHNAYCSSKEKEVKLDKSDLERYCV